MLVVTGTGRSGTSLVALWLQKMDLLEYDANWVEQFDAGLEPTDVSRVNGAIWIGNDMEYQNVKVQREAIGSFDYPIIKDPKFFYGNVLDTWLSVRKDLKFLICLRDFNAVYKSRISVKQLAQVRKPEELRYDLGKFVSTLVFNDIEFEIIKFPNFTDNFQSLFDAFIKLNPEFMDGKEYGNAFAHSKTIWDSLVDKAKIHF